MRSLDVENNPDVAMDMFMPDGKSYEIDITIELWPESRSVL